MLNERQIEGDRPTGWRICSNSEYKATLPFIACSSISECRVLRWEKCVVCVSSSHRNSDDMVVLELA